jgi:hypothetical protein
MSDQIFEKVSGDMDVFKKILNKIPGFNGYVERQKRRDADRLLRETIANRVEEQWQRISELQKQLISQGEITIIDDLEASALKLRTFADRIRRAAEGYAGLFDAVKINQEELQLMYEYDAELLDLVDEVSKAIDNVELSIGGDGVMASIRNLNSISQKCIDTFNKRKEVILTVVG